MGHQQHLHEILAKNLYVPPWMDRSLHQKICVDNCWPVLVTYNQAMTYRNFCRAKRQSFLASPPEFADFFRYNSLFWCQSIFQKVKNRRLFDFRSVTATKFTVKGVKKRKFCNLIFGRVVKPFEVEKSFCFWRYVCFQKWRKICCSSKQVH